MFTDGANPVAVAMKKRESLLASDALSNPQANQCIAVVTSLAMQNMQSPSSEASALLSERTAILTRCQLEGVATVEVTHPSTGDLASVLTDPTITDICLIGDGSVGSIFVRDAGQERS